MRRLSHPVITPHTPDRQWFFQADAGVVHCALRQCREPEKRALMRELNDTLNVLHQDGDQPDRAEKKNITKS